MNKMATVEKNEVARPLKVLIPLINDALDHEHEAGIEYRRKAGAYFLEARVNFGTAAEWYSWIGRTFKHRETGNSINERTVRKYVELAETTKQFVAAGVRIPFRTMSHFTDPSREHHQPAWHEPVREALNTVNVERLLQEKQTRATPMAKKQMRQRVARLFLFLLNRSKFLLVVYGGPRNQITEMKLFDPSKASEADRQFAYYQLERMKKRGDIQAMTYNKAIAMVQRPASSEATM